MSSRGQSQALSGYLNIVSDKIQQLAMTQKPELEAVAQKIYKSLAHEGIWHLFGAGHSHMAVEEAFHRAGGLIPVNPWLEEYLMPHAGPSRNGPLEKLPGLAQVIYGFYKPEKGEILTIISNSGINSVAIEMAELANKNGVVTVCITNLEHSKKAASRHSSKSKLYEVCKHVIDTGGLVGDAAVKIPKLDIPVGPLSTLLSVFTINCLAIRVCEIYSEYGKAAPVYLSANLPGGEERNRKLEVKYRPRIPRLQ